MRKRWFRQILRRRVFVILLLALQIYLLVGLIGDASRLARWTNAAFRLLSVLGWSAAGTSPATSCCGWC